MWGLAPRERQVARVVAVDGGEYAAADDGDDAENYRCRAKRSMKLFGFVSGIEGGPNSGQVVVGEKKSQTAAGIAVRRGECPRRVCAMAPGTCDSLLVCCPVASAPWSPFFRFFLIFFISVVCFLSSCPECRFGENLKGRGFLVRFGSAGQPKMVEDDFKAPPVIPLRAVETRMMRRRNREMSNGYRKKRTEEKQEFSRNREQAMTPTTQP